MRERILDLVNNHPRHYTRMISKNPEMLLWVYQNSYETENLAERIYVSIHGAPDKTECGKIPMFNTFFKGFRQFCGHNTACECSKKNLVEELKARNAEMTPERRREIQEKQKQTLMERYGVDNALKSKEIQDRIKATNLERYGVETPLQSKEIQTRIKATMIEKYGVEYPFQSRELLEKSHTTLRERYGDDFMKIARSELYEKYGGNTFDNEEIKKQIKNTLMEKYGVDHYSKTDEFKEKIKNTLMERYGVENPAQMHYSPESFAVMNDPKRLAELFDKYNIYKIAEILGLDRTDPIMKRHNEFNLARIKKRVRSKYEEEIAVWLADNQIDFIRNKRMESGTVDFLIPSHNLAIEFNGLFTHSEFSRYGKILKIDRNYHHKKFKMCERAGIQLITIFEDEWNNYKDILKNKVLIKCGRALRGTPARKLKVKPISKEETRDFLESHHLQGYTVASVKLGAFDGDQLVGVMSFKKTGDIWELVRYASTTLLHAGMFSKMFSYFVKEHAPSQVISFSDNRMSDGNVYSRNGFLMTAEIRPDYAVTDYRTREHKFNWRKDRIRSRFGVDISGKTELELTLELSRDRIWDCGKRKWVWKP